MADKLLLGCIADDFTGATDLASQLVAAGMRVVQTIGVPGTALDDDCDAVVVALKSRTVAPERAVEASLAALDWLRDQGCERFYFKYCSTFDSTAQGNIGPVTDALMEALGVDFTLAVPALPANRRTVYNGYLFANDVLLNESGMQDHPLTPMTDPCLLRVLAPQTRHRVGLVSHHDLAKGVEAVRARIEALRGEGVGIAICDTLDESDLHLLAAAASDSVLLTGGSGLGLSIPATLEGFTARADAGRLPPIEGRALILSGSCSRATLGQLEHARGRYPSIAVEVESLAEDFDAHLQSLFDYCLARLDQGPVVVHASSPAERLREVQARFGVEASGALVERALAGLAQRLVDEAGVRRILVAGGESSGAVVEALGVEGLKIGPSIDTGVPWTHSVGREPALALALKSGNFGQVDFMTRAWEVLP
ncbi:3-oxo-tetronate kinase [Halotalea alkalilenta]|uniref:3-oxo-tetronate kinase n=1 Tax=Halotalea alkalilenta TaxID=376489 RepID=UPI00048873D0|nr:3-oxo-tetronate kinase [Halotalea alkalilenta]